jgi:hypothetical protein
MVKNGKPKVVPPCIAALRIVYPGTFSESEIPSKKARASLNDVCRTFDGIQAIVQILYANEVERESQGPDGDLLDTKLVYGLLEALVYLSDGGDAAAVALGQHLQDRALGGAS